MTQEEKLSLRLRQILSEEGLHEIRIYVTPDKVIQFWIVRTEKAEGEAVQRTDVLSVV